MPTKQQIEKESWEWTSSTGPQEITSTHVETAYRVNLPACTHATCRRNCKGNPNCLVGLGEKEWLGDISDDKWHEVDDPDLERRTKGMFVGLKNLGATCYVNTFLQVWFHNKSFRAAIYLWRPLDKPYGRLMPVIKGQRGPRKSFGVHKSLQQPATSATSSSAYSSSAEESSKKTTSSSEDEAVPESKRMKIQPTKYSLASALNEVVSAKSGTSVSEKDYVSLNFRLKRAEYMRNMRAKKKKEEGNWTQADEERLKKTKDEMNEMLNALAKKIAQKSPPTKSKKGKKDKSLNGVSTKKHRKKNSGEKKKHHEKKKSKKKDEDEKRLAYNAYMRKYMKERSRKKREERLAEKAKRISDEKENTAVKVKEEVDTSVIVEKPFKMVVEVQNNLLMAAPDDEDSDSPPPSPKQNGATHTGKKKLTEDDHRIRRAAYARRWRAKMKKEKGQWTDEDEYKLRQKNYGIIPSALKPDPTLLERKPDKKEKPEVKPQLKPKAKSQVKPKEKPHAKPQNKPQAKPQTKPKKQKSQALALAEKRERKATYERLHRVEIKKVAGVWTDEDEARFVDREGMGSDERLKIFRDQPKLTGSRNPILSKEELDKNHKIHMKEFMEQRYPNTSDKAITAAEKKERHSVYKLEYSRYRKVLEKERKEYALQTLAKRREQANKSRRPESLTEHDKECEKSRANKQMQYHKKRKVLLKACRKKSPIAAKMGRGQRRKFASRRLPLDGSTRKADATDEDSVADETPLAEILATSGNMNGVSTDNVKSVRGSSRGSGRGRGKSRGRGRASNSADFSNGIPNGVLVVPENILTVTLDQVKSGVVATRGRGRGRGQGRGQGSLSRNLASGDATSQIANGDMNATRGRGSGWRQGRGRGRGRKLNGDEVVMSWKKDGKNRGFYWTEISAEIELTYTTYPVGHDLQGTCYVVNGYEYIRNRSTPMRTFLRCRNRKTCFAKAVIIHKTDKAVVTCRDHNHAAPKEVVTFRRKGRSKAKPYSTSDQNVKHEMLVEDEKTEIFNDAKPEKMEVYDSAKPVGVKIEPPDDYVAFEIFDKSPVEVKFEPGVTISDELQECKETKAPSVDETATVVSATEDHEDKNNAKCQKEEPEAQDERCRGIVRDELKILSDEALTPTSICGHLQLIFALMEYSNRRYIDPSGLINCLGLDSALQQDAQEFSKLFISLLEDTLQQQPEPIVRNIIKEQFCGKYAYVTRCNNCAQGSERVSEFYELDLNIKGHKELGESLQEFLKEEKLEGANRYSCDNCKSKQDATRHIQLLELPPVLNVQLLRFVFDRQSGTKKKLNTFIQFPATLDLSPYLQGRNHDAVYDLTAVLIHRGPTAYSGHYIAHIRDDASGSWYKFNDEDVEKMEGKNLKLGYEDDIQEGGSKGGKRPRVPKGFHASKNAYMLVYHKRTHAAQQPPASTGPLVDYLEEMIFRDNLHFESWIQEMAAMRDDNVKSGKARHQEIKELYQQLAPSGGKYEWITADWLKDWLNDENTECKPINNSSMVCCHDNVDPDKINDAKRISAKAAQLLYSKYGGGPRLSEKALCYKCVRERCNIIRLKSDLNTDHKYITTNTKVKMEPQGDSPVYWVGKASLRNWRRLALQRVEIVKKDDDDQPATQNCHSSDTDGSPNQNEDQLRAFNEEIMCQHENLSPDESCRRVVSSEVWSRLRKYFPDCAEFSQDEEICGECQMANMEEDQMNDLLRRIASDYKTSLPQLFADRQRPTIDKKDVTEIYVVNRTFVDEWRDFVKQPLKNQPPSAINNNILICSHNKFMFEPGQFDEFSCQMLVYIWPNEWETLVKQFGSDQIVKFKRLTQDNKSVAAFMSDPEPCPECISARYSQEEKNRFEYSGARVYIRKVTADLLGGNSSQDEDRGTCSEGSIKEEDPDFSGQQNGIKRPKLSMSPAKSSSRRSSRHRKVRGEKEVIVSSNNTLKELKVKVMHAFSVAPFDQTLLLNGRILTGESNDATLASLGIEPECIIALKVDAPQMEDPLVMDEIYRASAVPEEGFKGTGLLNH